MRLAVIRHLVLLLSCGQTVSGHKCPLLMTGCPPGKISEPLTDSPLILYHCSPSQNDLLLLRCSSPENLSILRSIGIFLTKHSQVMWDRVFQMGFFPAYHIWEDQRNKVLSCWYFTEPQIFETIPNSFLLTFLFQVQSPLKMYMNFQSLLDTISPYIQVCHSILSCLCEFIITISLVSLWFGGLLKLITVGYLLFIDQRS